MLQFCANMLLRPPLPLVPGVLRSNSMHSNSTLINWRRRRVNMLWVYVRLEPLQLTDSPSKAASAFPACSMFQRLSSLCLFCFHAYLSFWQVQIETKKKLKLPPLPVQLDPTRRSVFGFGERYARTLLSFRLRCSLGPEERHFHALGTRGSCLLYYCGCSSICLREMAGLKKDRHALRDFKWRQISLQKVGNW